MAQLTATIFGDLVELAVPRNIAPLLTQALGYLEAAHDVTPPNELCGISPNLWTALVFIHVADTDFILGELESQMKRIGHSFEAKESN